ncbi:hypothetical protein THAOC_27392 [Thalassiosira oceanica]|uniref:Uncharacterized protein n=1 Tax=Thalassiosira oceanica TaxID=159749 RepID=K0S2Y8_THAOC|nr:hypothetical protein THAOC_27392 [Thalassiosira oceanica]|eukprot:EJK53222.1 hypothetical protein THAOC_27392 [Thalassiosira oceanica]
MAYFSKETAEAALLLDGKRRWPTSSSVGNITIPRRTRNKGSSGVTRLRARAGLGPTEGRIIGASQQLSQAGTTTGSLSVGGSATFLIDPCGRTSYIPRRNPRPFGDREPACVVTASKEVLTNATSIRKTTDMDIIEILDSDSDGDKKPAGRKPPPEQRKVSECNASRDSDSDGDIGFDGPRKKRKTDQKKKATNPYI